MIRIFYSKQIVERELSFDDLALEIGREYAIDLVRECIAVVKLYIADESVLVGQIKYLDLEQMLVVNVVRHCIVVVTPRIQDLHNTQRA